MSKTAVQHGGNLSAAAKRFGGEPHGWLDLSTGVNPCPFDLGPLPRRIFEKLPDPQDLDELERLAKDFWSAPAGCEVLAVPGLSSVIPRLVDLAVPGRVSIPSPTYGEYHAVFSARGWENSDLDPTVQILVNPNNPDGRIWESIDCDENALTIVDESFGDVCPASSLISLAGKNNTIVLKGLGKFWGLAGVRLGYVFAGPDTIASLRAKIGPWPISGPAIHAGLIFRVLLLKQFAICQIQTVDRSMA